MEAEKKWREPGRPALFFGPVCSPFARNQLEIDTPYPERKENHHESEDQSQGSPQHG
jgi:hypothetical protein